MNKGIVAGVLLLVLVVAIGAFFLSSNLSKAPVVLNNSNNSGDALVSESESSKQNTNTNDSSSYVSYSLDNFEKAKDKKRVLFFHAAWCPFCRAADEVFNENLSEIPDDVVLFKTDYDKESELKNKYNITYQHTFVLVDENGNEIKKWNGGDIEELISNTS